MVDKRPLSDTELDDLFQAARDTAPLPSGDLVTRILADAKGVQDDLEADAAQALAAREPVGVFRSILAAIGGWPAAAGLATATVAGVMIGVATPESVESWTTGVLSFDVEAGELAPLFSDLLEEG